MTPHDDRWTPVAPDELVLLQEALAGDWAGAAELRTQLPGLQVRRGCRCGCGTLDLLPRPGPPAPTLTSPSRREGEVVDETGDVVGGLLLFLIPAGRLSTLEVYSWLEPLAMPPPDRVRWRVTPGPVTGPASATTGG